MELNEQQKLSVGRWNKKKKKVKIVPYIKLSDEEKSKREELGKSLYESSKPIPEKKSVYLTGTREAFTALLQERGIYKRLGVAVSTVSTWKQYIREGNSISLDKMEEVLRKAGCKVAVEKIWKLK